MSEARRPGRWRTGQQNRQRIIDAARDRFMRDGYERATVRAIAAAAGVDVAMVYYFFDSKEGLFTASALTGPEHPLHQLATLLDEGTDQIGPRLVRRVLEHWDEGAEARRRYVTAIFLRLDPTSSEMELVNAGHKVCTNLSGGETPDEVINDVIRGSAIPKSGATALVDTAMHQFCPQFFN